MIYKVRQFTESPDFSNAIKVTVASVVPVIVSRYYDNFDAGLAMAIGALLAFPSDISSNLRHKINGLVVASIIVAGSAFLISLAYPVKWIFYPIFAVLVFFLSMISAYGSRATMVSFSGLLSVSIVFSGIYSGAELYRHCLFMFAGGIFYLIVSLAFYFLRPMRYAEYQLAECTRMTAKYLKLRGDMWNADANRSKIIEKQLKLQVQLNVIHENIRETLLRSQSGAGSSHQNRKLLIAFISLMDIMELGLSTSFEHSKLHEKFRGHKKVLDAYQNIAYHLAATLKRLSKKLENKSDYRSAYNLFADLEIFENAIQEYENELGSDVAAEGIYMLTTMLQYAEKQVESIHIVERAITIAGFRPDFKGKDRDLEKFVTPQYYPISILKENLSFSSSTFRHSLRLTIMILIGFVIGQSFPLQNSYWILLTIVVILRPGYGLTKERSWQRIYGTVLGGVIAFGLLSVVRDVYAISLLAVLFMILGYAFSNTNYKVGATFVTMYVIFIYGMLTPDVGNVIQYRIIDTVIGAVLSFAGSYVLWPSWEFLSIPDHLEKAIQANRDYLKEIAALYKKKGLAPVSYRLARKNAFIEIGNLMASFQRMSQEPKSKQKQLRKIYKLAELNHTLLSSLASLGTYMQTHNTTKASEAFEAVVNATASNLESSIMVLKGDRQIDSKPDITRHVTNLKSITEKAIGESDSDPVSLHRRKQEAQLVIEQLLWLISLSESIFRTINSMQGSSGKS